ncbi:MAG: HupE/UreJ family protein [Variibacter sp.]|nr:HupE/UreJ family protein [Variibacter sp.]
MRFLRCLGPSVLFVALGPAIASAHGGAGHVATFAAGAAHPLSGLDHLLAAFAVGLWAALAGGLRPLVFPAIFVAAMAGAAVAAACGILVPLVEPAIAGSVAALGALTAAAARAPLVLGGALIALSALVHGQAHGAEGGAAPAYLAGLMLATALLHGAGVAAGRRALALARPLLARALGAGIAAAGLVMVLAA